MSRTSKTSFFAFHLENFGSKQSIKIASERHHRTSSGVGFIKTVPTDLEILDRGRHFNVVLAATGHMVNFLRLPK